MGKWGLGDQTRARPAAQILGRDQASGIVAARRDSAWVGISVAVTNIILDRP